MSNDTGIIVKHLDGWWVVRSFNASSGHQNTLSRHKSRADAIEAATEEALGREYGIAHIDKEAPDSPQDNKAHLRKQDLSKASHPQPKGSSVDDLIFGITSDYKYLTYPDLLAKHRPRIEAYAQSLLKAKLSELLEKKELYNVKSINGEIVEAETGIFAVRAEAIQQLLRELE